MGRHLSEYVFSIEPLHEIYEELEPLFREHYAEMTERLERDGFSVSPYNPRLDEYFKASKGGWLLTSVVRLDGKPCGYANAYITSDMHNRDLIAVEDTLFISKEHRGSGVGRRFMEHGLQVLREKGVKRFTVSALTDLRVAELWRRMGFKDLAQQMQYTF